MEHKAFHANRNRLAAFTLLAATALFGRAAGADNVAPDASTPPVFDIPRIEGISMDGDAAAWADRGFDISVMHSASARRLPSDQFDARVKLAWDDRGLVLLADVTDPNLREDDFSAAPGSGPSVEVFEADAMGGNEHWQTALSLGTDSRHPVVQTLKFDAKAQIRRPIDPTVTAVAKKTSAGFLVEAMLPWSVLGVNAQSGRELGFQIYVDDGRGSQLLWFPMGGADSNTKVMQRIRLADTAGAAVTAAAAGGYEHLRRTRISIATIAAETGKKAEVRAGDDVLGEGTLKADGRLAVANISLPMPAFGTAFGPLAAWVDGHRVDSIDLPDADDARKNAIANLSIAADSSVFSGSNLPAIDFVNPVLADDLLGEYEVHARYYDSDYNAVTRADRPGRYGAVVEVTSENSRPIKRYITLYRQPKDFNFRSLRLKTAMQLPREIGVDEAVARQQVTAEGEFLARQLRYSRYRDDSEAILLAGLNEISPDSAELPRRPGPEGKNIAWWYGLKKKIGDLTPYRYLVHVPETNDTKRKFPLILFLHGSGERGEKLDLVTVHGPPKILKIEPDWAFRNQFIVVSPQCPDGAEWDPLQLRDLLEEVSAKYPVDPDRIYVTGLSMGGYGSWQLAEWFPERIAAVVPISGGGDPADAPRTKDIPTWVVHGGRDPVVPIGDAYEMVQTLRDLHGRIRFTVFPEYGHNSWEPAYDDAHLYTWLLAQRRGQPGQRQSNLPDTRPAEE